MVSSAAETAWWIVGLFFPKNAKKIQKGRITLKHENVRQQLIDRTIHSVATKGMDKTTTKSIVADSGISEVYIYRHFENKEDLLAKAFDQLDNEFVEKTMLHLPVMYTQGLPYKDRCKFFFMAMWEFLLSNREKCLAFVQYYYSPYFVKVSHEAHKQRYMPLVKKFSAAFRQEADVWMILNHILNVILDFAVKVHNGQMPNDDSYSEHVFRVVYRSVEQYFKGTEESDS